jgi:glycosyltransferase involved in cell wall biosynthesis
MKVLYDSQIFGMQDYGGISRYFAEIIKRLPKKGVQVHVNLTISHNTYIKDLKIGEYDKFLAKNRYRNYIYTLINEVFGIPKIIFSKYDIFHSTYYEPYFLPFIGKIPLVVTVYDMVHELFSDEYINLNKKIIGNKKVLVQRADRIIAISENTKNDIVNIYGIDPKKITVIYLGSSLNRWNKRKRLNFPKTYLLYVGHRWIYKNFDKFIRAISNLIKEKNISIVCAGGNSFSPEEIVLMNKLEISDRVVFQSIKTDEDLSECYARAEAFIYPSRYEGFAIPVLEAFANDCPVIISNTSSFPEIAQNAAVYFDPGNCKSIEAAVKKVLGNEKLKQQLIKAGSIRLKNFSWDKAAKETAEVYKKVYWESVYKHRQQ